MLLSTKRKMLRFFSSSTEVLKRWELLPHFGHDDNENDDDGSNDDDNENEDEGGNDDDDIVPFSAD